MKKEKFKPFVKNEDKTPLSDREKILDIRPKLVLTDPTIGKVAFATCNGSKAIIYIKKERLEKYLEKYPNGRIIKVSK